MPPKCSLIYFAVACAAGISDELSIAALLPSLTNPILTGVPVAGFEGPSRAL
jgi:hypothetical protein